MRVRVLLSGRTRHKRSGIPSCWAARKFTGKDAQRFRIHGPTYGRRGQWRRAACRVVEAKETKHPKSVSESVSKAVTSMMHPEPPPPLTILHITDLHVGPNTDTPLTRKVTAMIKRLCEAPKLPDFVVVSGDLANKGQPAEYAKAALVLRQLSEGFALEPDRIVLAPGNHDVNRQQIDPFDEAGFQQLLVNPEAADDAWSSHRERLLRRHHDFYTFAREAGHTVAPSVFGVHDHVIGMLPLNSAWRCSGDKDKGQLFIALSQLTEGLTAIREADIKIGIAHHPISWLQEDEQAVIATHISQTLHLLCQGHRHLNDVHNRTYPNGATLFCGSPAFHGAPKSGFSIINIVTKGDGGRAATVTNWQYHQRRDAFAMDSELADTGQMEFPLSTVGSSALAAPAYAKLVRQAAESDKEIQVAVQALAPRLCRELQFQFIEPTLQEQLPVGGKTRSRAVCVNDIIESKLNWIVSGERLAGKSLCLALAKSRLARKQRIPLVLSSSLLTGDDTELVGVISRQLGISKPKAQGQLDTGLTILVDDADLSNPKCIATLDAWIKTSAKVQLLVTARRAEVMVPQLVTSSEAWRVAFIEAVPLVEICRIGEQLRLQGLLSDTDAGAVRAFVQSMFEHELPRTPWVVLMFLELWSHGQRAPIETLSELLNIYSQYRLERLPAKSGLAPDVAARALQVLSNYMFDNAQTVVPRTAVRQIIAKDLDTFGLSFDADRMVNDIISTGLLLENTEGLEFTFPAFMDFYYASYLFSSAIDPGATLTDQDLRQRGPAYALLNGMRPSDLLTQKAFAAALANAPEVCRVLLESDLNHLDALTLPNVHDLPEASDPEQAARDLEVHLSSAERARSGRRNDQVRKRHSVAASAVFFDHYKVALSLLGSGTLLKGPTKVTACGDAVTLSISLVRLISEWLRDDSDQELGAARGSEQLARFSAVRMHIATSAAGWLLSSYASSVHFGQTIKVTYAAESDPSRRVVLLIWLSAVDPVACVDLLRNFIAEHPGVAHLQMLQIWFYTQYFANSLVDGRPDAVARESLRQVAAAVATRATAGSRRRGQVNSAAEALIRSADKEVQRQRH